MASDNVSLTYEKLFDLARKERTLSELQKLDNSFYMDVVSYLNDKSSMAKNNGKGGLFSKSDMQNSQKQLDNIQKLIKDIYIRRQKKILNLAMMKSRTGSNLLDTSALLAPEKELFHHIVAKLDNHKEQTLFTLLSGQLPQGASSIITKPETKTNSKPIDDGASNFKGDSGDESSLANTKETEVESKVKVMFLGNVPKFVGKELEVYGPFNKDQTAELPSMVATVLINKGHAKKI